MLSQLLLHKILIERVACWLVLGLDLHGTSNFLGRGALTGLATKSDQRLRIKIKSRAGEAQEVERRKQPQAWLEQLWTQFARIPDQALLGIGKKSTLLLPLFVARQHLTLSLLESA